MTLPPLLSDLKDFALKCIAAEHYPQSRHVFRMFECDACQSAEFELTIEYHSGSLKGRFRGVIWGNCSRCENRKRLFSFTAEHRKLVREVKPICGCGHASFSVGECERFESDDGIAGFFDEGVVVGKCLNCGRNQAFVYTD